MRQMIKPTARQIVKPAARVVQPRPVMDATTRQALIYNTRQWKTVRLWFKKAGFTTCCACRVVKSDVLDHILPVQNFPAMAFDPRNLQPLCRRCHDLKSDTIDAPCNDPLRYRHDLKHLADHRPPELRRWADALVEAGAERILGGFAAGSKTPGKLEGWVPAC